MTAHPTDFYIAHRLFRFGRLGQTVAQWGNLTDGPVDKAQLMEDLRNDPSRNLPSLQNLRVWRFQDDVPPRDVTEDVLDEFFAQEVAA
jgi:hypothetical protein